MRGGPLTVPNPTSALLARWLLPTLAAVAAVELLARSPLAFRAPEFVLFPLTLFAAYRYGLRLGLLSALVVVSYLLYCFHAYDSRSAPFHDETWRIAMLVTGIPAVALALGLLRDRFDQLLIRERSARAEAEEGRERTHRILESISDAFVVVDPEWRFVYLNAAAERLLGRSRLELLDTHAWEALPQVLDSFFQKYNHARAESGESGESGSVQFQTAALESDAWYEVHAFPTEDGVTVYFRDITERRMSEEHLRSLSMVDELTGLYNRRGFIALAEQQGRVATRTGRGLLLVFLDLDDFKQINDTLGHPVGDQALREVADILRHTFRESDVVGRLGGDEFAALALESRPGSAPVVLGRIQERLRAYNSRPGAQYRLALSLGTAWFDGDGPCDIEEMLALADRKMYRQKREKQV